MNACEKMRRSNLIYLGLFSIVLFVVLFALPSVYAINSTNDPAAINATATPSAIPNGFIDISSIPTGLDVIYLKEGRRINAGKTPIKLEFPAGLITIIVTRDGYEAYSKDVLVEAGKVVDFVAQLKTIPTVAPTATLAPVPTAIDYTCSYADAKDRIKCRLGLPNNAQAKSTLIIPEECRGIMNNASQVNCTTLYQKLAPCLNLRDDEQREKCARTELKIDEAAIQKALCDKKKTETGKKDCNLDLRDKTYSLIKFRLSILEEKARLFHSRGINGALVVDFIAHLEKKKQDFNAAKNVEAKKTVIWEVKKLWGDFKRDAVRELTVAK
jgi:hypothetical protein